MHMHHSTKCSETESESKVILLVGGHNNLGHALVNEMTGLYCLWERGLLEKSVLQEIWVGNHDFFGIREFLDPVSSRSRSRNVGNMKTTIHGYAGKGILFGFHFYRILTDFLQFYLDDFIPRIQQLHSPFVNTSLCPFNEEEPSPVILIVLRCGVHEDPQQVDKITRIIDRILGICPDARFVLEGFFLNHRHDWETLEVGYRERCGAQDMLETYRRVEKEIVERCHLSDKNYRSTIGMHIHEALAYHKTVSWGIFNVGSASTIGCWMSRIRGIEFGREDTERYREMDLVFHEDHPELVYKRTLELEDIDGFITLTSSKLD